MSEDRPVSTELLHALAECTNDPVAFVGTFFPWGQPGSELEKFTGPEKWQLRVLTHIAESLDAGMAHGEAINEAIQIAVASGHGVGKSTLVSWIILWAISTFEDTRGVVTANTETQLKTKTWAELGKWHRLFMGSHLFKLTATALISVDEARERTWRIDMVPWSERNTEAFAGLHNKGKRVLVIFDEASAIPDVIWETAEGAMTDSETQIIWAVFGNPTRNSGRFRDCFGRFEQTWWHEQVDSRSVNITNKSQFEKWIRDYGDDSDFVRVRILGTFPRVGELEFISTEVVDAAMSRDAQAQITDPLAIGVDVARYGAAESVIWFRKGRDASTIPFQFYRGLSTVELATKVQEAHFEYHSDGIFIDGGGVGGGVVDNVRHLHLFCHDVQFGGKDDVGGFATGNAGELYANKRAAMWGAMRAWLNGGSIPNDPDLRSQLTGLTYTYNLRGEIQLEKKEDMTKRGLPSPDRADALALTFAYPLQSHEFAGGPHQSKKNLVESEYDPFAPERMLA
jgi:hypothetical protein